MVKLSGVLAEQIDPFAPLDMLVGLVTGKQIFNRLKKMQLKTGTFVHKPEHIFYTQ